MNAQSTNKETFSAYYYMTFWCHLYPLILLQITRKLKPASTSCILATCVTLRIPHMEIPGAFGLEGTVVSKEIF